jgi:hypothetical protein
VIQHITLGEPVVDRHAGAEVGQEPLSGVGRRRRRADVDAFQSALAELPEVRVALGPTVHGIAGAPHRGSRPSLVSAQVKRVRLVDRLARAARPTCSTASC